MRRVCFIGWGLGGSTFSHGFDPVLASDDAGDGETDDKFVSMSNEYRRCVPVLMVLGVGDNVV